MLKILICDDEKKEDLVRFMLKDKEAPYGIDDNYVTPWAKRLLTEEWDTTTVKTMFDCCEALIANQYDVLFLDNNIMGSSKGIQILQDLYSDKISDDGNIIIDNCCYKFPKVIFTITNDYIAKNRMWLLLDKFMDLKLIETGGTL